MWIRQIVLILLSTALLWGTEGCSSEESPKAESPESSAEQVRILDASEPTLESNVEMPPELAPMPKGAGLSDLQPAALKKYPLDNLLRLNHVQVLGTHNSYHIAPPAGVDAWMYTHAPLDVQLEKQGVRQLEIDIYWDKDRKVFQVYHVPLVDQNSNCDRWTDCLRVLKYWSDRRPQHLPIFVLIETKLGETQEPENMFDVLEKETLQVFPRERILTPDFVRGDSATLQDALKKKGWPTLQQVRGKVVFFLLTSDKREKVYTQNFRDLKGRLMFVNTEPDKPYAAIRLMDGPVGNEKEIQAAVKNGFLIRTRADANLSASKEANEKRLNAALVSGAHMLSSDHPTPRKDGYVAKIPAGAPARCNPVVAPKECTSKALEDQP